MSNELNYFHQFNLLLNINLKKQNIDVTKIDVTKIFINGAITFDSCPLMMLNSNNEIVYYLKNIPNTSSTTITLQNDDKTLYRTAYKITDTAVPASIKYCDTIFYNIFYITNHNITKIDECVTICASNPTITIDEIKKKTIDTSMSNWIQLVPSLLIDLCTNKITNPFYFNLVNFPVTINKKVPFKAPYIKYDTTGDNSILYAFSLRLINTAYSGPCCMVNGKNVLFNKDTGLIDYMSIPGFNKSFSSTDKSTNESVITFRVSYIYNQVSGWGEDKNSKTSSIDELAASFNNKFLIYDKVYLQLTAINGILIPILKWNGYIQLDSSKFTNDYLYNISSNIYFTVSSSIPIFQLKVHTYKMTNTTTSTSIICNQSYNNVTYTSTPTSTTVINNIVITDNFINDTISCTLNKSTMTGVASSSTDYLDNEDVKFGNNSNSTSFYSSQLIIFKTTVNVPRTSLNTVEDDLNTVWSYPDMIVPNNLLTCSSYVQQACKIDNTNNGCACYPDYVDLTDLNNPLSTFVDKIQNKPFVNTDKWCINTKCASNDAYKNPLVKNKSVCSSNCMAGIFATTTSFSDVNLNNIRVASNCDNKNGTDLSTQCTEVCKDGYKCGADATNGNKPTCLKSMTANKKCIQNYQSVITSKNKNICIPSEYTTKCVDNTICDRNQFCDKNVNSCINNSSIKHNVLYCIILSIIIIMCGVLLYKIFNKKLQSHSTLFFVIVISISILSSILFYHFYTYIEYYCEECSSDPNSACINNKCKCKTGYNIPPPNVNLSCTIPIKTCESLPYLPINLFSGKYYYSTVINDIIYVFADNANYKFINEKWIEISPLPFKQGYSQLNKPFSYKSSTSSATPPVTTFSDIKYVNPEILPSVTNMISVYNDNIYFVLPYDSSIFSGTTNEYCLLFVYDTKLNLWSSINTDKFMFLSIINLAPIDNTDDNKKNALYYNITSFIYKDALYIIGGYNYYFDYINSDIGKYDLLTHKWSYYKYYNNQIPFEFSYNLKSFIVNNNVYIVSNTTLYQFDNENKFNVIKDKLWSSKSESFYTGNFIYVTIYDTPNKVQYLIVFNNDTIYKINLTTTTELIQNLNLNQIYITFFSSPVNNFIPSTEIVNNKIKVISSFTLNNFLYMLTDNGEIFQNQFDSTFQNLITIPCSGITEVSLLNPYGLE